MMDGQGAAQDNTMQEPSAAMDNSGAVTKLIADMAAQLSPQVRTEDDAPRIATEAISNLEPALRLALTEELVQLVHLQLETRRKLEREAQRSQRTLQIIAILLSLLSMVSIGIAVGASGGFAVFLLARAGNFLSKADSVALPAAATALGILVTTLTNILWLTSDRQKKLRKSKQADS